jgi:hypothetical protein
MRIFGDRINLRPALAAMLLGAVIQSACIGDASDAEQGDRPTNAPVASGSKPDLNIGSSLPAMPGGGAASRKQSPSAGGGAPGADAGTQPHAASQACTEATQCASGFCVDGVCCNEACTGTCSSCNQAQSPGTCLPISDAEDVSASAPCTGANTCTVSADGQPLCKLREGQICSTNAECASGSCGSIVVPPDPADPYDLGYTYIGCQRSPI